MNRRDFLKSGVFAAGALSLGGCGLASSASGRPDPNRPNIIYILADDMGYGDIACLNENGKIPTPHLDQMAADGMAFTDAHSPSAVCTPTRYGVLTGRYSWRSRLKQGVLYGYSKHLIEEDRMTVASMLKQCGYHTACFGKWHLGWDWQTNSDNPEDVDYSKPVLHGPTTNGFDTCLCIPASLDMEPYVYLENDRVTAAPNRIGKGDTGKRLWREGPMGADFDLDEVLPTFQQRAVEYIDAQAKQAAPFFLYLPLSAPHTPILPTEPFRGKSGVNEYGDFVMQVDTLVGQVLAAVKRNGLDKNTLVIFTSDNGFAPQAGFEEIKGLGHNPSYVYRGHKADIFEGGHRIPYIARWPGRIQPGSVCDDTICLTDLMATTADIVGFTLPDNAAEDSVSTLPALLGTATGPLREATVHHSVNGSFSIRRGKWKLELCPGSGGWSDPRPNSARAKQLPPVQLYDLSTDIGETTNLQHKYPEVVQELTALLQQYKDTGRSVPRRT